jgi:hypothetical protein
VVLGIVAGAARFVLVAGCGIAIVAAAATAVQSWVRSQAKRSQARGDPRRARACRTGRRTAPPAPRDIDSLDAALPSVI